MKLLTIQSILLENNITQKNDAIIAYIKDSIEYTKFENKVFICGGYVRDELLGLKPKDIDLVVDLPDGGITFAKWITIKSKNFRNGSNPVIFERFGTAKFNLNGVAYKGIDLSNIDIEVVMPRYEKYKKNNRKPDVEYANLKVESERRDLTVNALFKNITTGEIIDLTGKGLEDLKNGIARPPLDPNITFLDDPLRLLRLIRQCLKYNWTIPSYVVIGMKNNAHNIVNISAERINDELSKIILLPNAEKGFDFMSDIGLLKYIMPELEELRGLNANPKFHHEDTYHHTLNVLKNMPPTLIKRLAGLLHDIGKSRSKQWKEEEKHYSFHGHEDVGSDMVKDILGRLKYPNDVIDQVADLVANHMWHVVGEPSEKSTRKLLNKLKSDVNDLLDLMYADRIASHAGHTNERNMSMLDIFKNNIETIKMKGTGEQSIKTTMPINGNDIMTYFNIKQGKKIGDLLAIAQEYVFEKPDITKEELLNYLQGFI